MSQRFIRCAHCGAPHDVAQRICPASGLVVRPGGNSRLFRSEPPAAAPPAAPAPATVPAPAPPARPARAVPGDLIGKLVGGKYLVRSILGEGGMGTVFEATHVTSGGLAAVKVLHADQAKKTNAVRRFHQEARAAGTIGHPNICEVFELGALYDGSPYLAMERLVGQTLADRIAAEKGLPLHDVIDILVQVLSALEAAHAKGIVHRDIKPDNVFLTRGGGPAPIVKLLDFGVSKMISRADGDATEEVDLTRIGMVMGTPHYLSPEQARGARDLDGRVDVYACGVILYEALTGRRPFSAPNYDALLLQILSAKPRPASQLRPSIPAALGAIIEKAMARDRGERFQTASELRRTLGEAREVVVPLDGDSPPDRRDVVPASTDPRGSEPVPSSIEIPISVSTDSLPSGERASVDVPAPTPPLAAPPESDDGPTERMDRPVPEKP